MARVLLAASRDLAGTARLPLTLSSAGMAVDVIAPLGAAVLSSSLITDAVAIKGGSADIAEKTMVHAPGYDRVIICDEPLLQTLLETDDPRADALLPGPRESITILMDKTRFPEAAEEVGISVPRWRVANSLGAVRVAAAEMGRVMVKGMHGYGGGQARLAKSPGGAATAALELGLPVLLEEQLSGDLALMPCLYERGRLVGVFAAHKRRTVHALGPSASIVPWPVDEELLDVATRCGARFGLHGFASYDLIRDSATGEVRVIEVDVLPAASLHVGRRLGVDMAGLLLEVLLGRTPAAPMLPRGGHPVPMFPQELERLQRDSGNLLGAIRWFVTPRALAEVPWRDAGLLAHYLNNGF